VYRKKDILAGRSADRPFRGGSIVADIVEMKIGDLTVRIDRGLCIASSNCINVAGEKFELDNEGIASCPVDALIVIDAEGNQIVPE
jgi:ferredoxin